MKENPPIVSKRMIMDYLSIVIAIICKTNRSFELGHVFISNYINSTSSEHKKINSCKIDELTFVF